METKFTPQQLKHFAAYEKVRSSNRYNMMDPRARRATGMERDDFLFVIENFEALQFEYRCQKGEA
jgi:hypothetical protein